MKAITNPIVLKLMDWLESIFANGNSMHWTFSWDYRWDQKENTSKKLAMIPNGCDLELVNSVTKNKKNKKFVAVLQVLVANGLDAVLDAAKILIQNDENDIEIQLIGDGVLKPKLIERAKIENIENCKFIDPMPKGDLFTYLQKEASVGLMILDNIPAFILVHL